MSVYEESNLLLKLYDLRREEKMRIARDWVFANFNPQSAKDVDSVMFSEHGANVRMVISYWDMAAAMVNRGAIAVDFFNTTNGEHYGVFAKLEPLLGELRSSYGPQFLANLEKLIDSTEGGRERVAMTRERYKEMRAKMAASKGTSA